MADFIGASFVATFTAVDVYVRNSERHGQVAIEAIEDIVAWVRPIGYSIPKYGLNV